MAVEIVTDFRVLIQLARALSQAKKTGDKEAISKAQTEHDAYKALCLKADKMTLGISVGMI